MTKRNSQAAERDIHALRLEKEREDREKKEKKRLKTQLKLQAGGRVRKKNLGKRRSGGPVPKKAKKDKKMLDIQN